MAENSSNMNIVNSDSDSSCITSLLIIIILILIGYNIINMISHNKQQTLVYDEDEYDY